MKIQLNAINLILNLIKWYANKEVVRVDRCQKTLMNRKNKELIVKKKKKWQQHIITFQVEMR